MMVITMTLTNTGGKSKTSFFGSLSVVGVEGPFIEMLTTFTSNEKHMFFLLSTMYFLFHSVVSSSTFN